MTIDRIVRATSDNQAPAGHEKNVANQPKSQQRTDKGKGDEKGEVPQGAQNALMSPRLLASGPDVPPALRRHGFPDLSGADLRDMTLDGVRLVGANMSGADLRGANFADATFIGCDFTDADLVDVCFADAVFENCNFSFARFGVTDISGAVFRHCRFAGGGAVDLPWAVADQRNDVVYVCADGTPLLLDQPPVILSCGARRLVLLGGRVLYRDEVVSLGHKLADALQISFIKLLDVTQQKYIMKT